MGLNDQWRTIGNLKNLNPNLLFSGYYWHCAAHQLLRGPFATAVAADADAKQLGPVCT